MSSDAVYRARPSPTSGGATGAIVGGKNASLGEMIRSLHEGSVSGCRRASPRPPDRLLAVHRRQRPQAGDSPMTSAK